MIETKGYAAMKAGGPLEPFSFSRRELAPNDILVEILYCGICHSDIHQVKNEWGGATFPLVPGHEIVGRVLKGGSQAKRFSVGDAVGIGCFVDSCGTCESCREGLQQYCTGGLVWTYNSKDRDGNMTQGGYSRKIVIREDYALEIPRNLPLERVAPLLCAGITTYSPLRRFKVGKGSRVGVMGLGGLGHMAVKLASRMGADVTVLSHSPNKEADSRVLGATGFVRTNDSGGMARLSETLDVMIDTISAPHDPNLYLGLLKRDGAMVLVGVPEAPLSVHAFSLIGRRRNLTASLIGGLPETQELLDFCGREGIGADVEVISPSEVNKAYERTLSGDVRYRFVIDMRSLD